MEGWRDEDGERGWEVAGSFMSGRRRRFIGSWRLGRGRCFSKLFKPPPLIPPVVLMAEFQEEILWTWQKFFFVLWNICCSCFFSFSRIGRKSCVTWQKNDWFKTSEKKKQIFLFASFSSSVPFHRFFCAKLGRRREIEGEYWWVIANGISGSLFPKRRLLPSDHRI